MRWFVIHAHRALRAHTFELQFSLTPRLRALAVVRLMTKSNLVGRSHLARRVAGPALVCVRECAHLTKAEQPRNLGDMQLVVLEVTNRQVAPQVLKYFSKVQPFVRELSCKRPLAHSQTASDVFHEHFSMRKHRRDCVLNSRTQLAHIITFSIG